MSSVRSASSREIFGPRVQHGWSAESRDTDRLPAVSGAEIGDLLDLLPDVGDGYEAPPSIGALSRTPPPAKDP